MDSAKNQPISTQKNSRIDIVSGYFLVFGVLGILVSLLLIISLILLVLISILMGQVRESVLLFPPLFPLVIIAMISIIYSTVLNFKIRSALRKREVQGLQSAFIYIIVGGIIGLFMLLYSILQSGQWQNLFLSLSGIALSLIILCLLYSQKKAFTNYTIKSLNKHTIIVMILFVLSNIPVIFWQIINNNASIIIPHTSRDASLKYFSGDVAFVPFEERVNKDDEKRLMDYSIQVLAIRSFYILSGRLPSSLAELTHMQKLNFLKNNYQYKILSEQSYSICTTFAADTRAGRYPVTDKLYNPEKLNFHHNKGYDCFIYHIEDYLLPVSRLKPVTVPTNSSIFKECMLMDDKSPNITLKLTGLYELDDNIVFTPNNLPKYANMKYWSSDSVSDSRSVVHLNAARIFDLRFTKVNGQTVKLSRGMEYNISLYDNLGNETDSQQYLFLGNRIVLQDPRCPPLEKRQ